MKLDSILKSLAEIVSLFKPRAGLVKSKAEKRDIKNETRKKRHELKQIRLQKKIDRKLKIK